ncbi:MAG: response regulator [Lachnospiraceae bacterium]|nr:response regulator [Lachnospiraceae bacterium]
MNDTLMDSIRQIGESIPGGFFVYHADGGGEILYANEVMLDIFGCHTIDEFKELTGATFHGLVYPEDLSVVEESILRQIRNSEKQLDYVEYRIVRKDGSIRWVDDYGRLVHTKEYGDVYYVLIRDITEIHDEREESIRRADVIEGLSADYASIYLIDLANGQLRPYRLLDSHFQEIISGMAEDVPGRTALGTIVPMYAERFVLKEDQDRFLSEVNIERIQKKLAEQEAYSVNYRIRGEGDSYLYMQMSIVRTHGAHAGRYAVMGFRNETEHILKAQQDIADKLNMEMELQKEKHANEIKSSFLFNISHDIRTPMNAIKGFTDLALMHLDEPEKLRDYLGKEDESNRHLLSLIDDLLEMSKLDYGKIEVREDACDLKETLEATIDMFRAQTEEKHLALVEELELPDQKVYIDESRFQRIMGNLISNAVKFTPPGGQIKISARRKQTSDSGYARYEFSVSDTGIGMTEEFMHRMYEAFEREESSTQSGYIGTGLGLAITKKMLDVVGGSISVKSKRGEGSVFTVGMPLKLVGFSSERVAANEVTRDVHKASGEHRILLVEDIDINRMLAENILRDAGFLVDSVPDGSDAVEAMKKQPVWYYDLVLMDIQMPVMNGYEATRAIRAMGREDTDRIPIIALSANARDEDKKESMESGMNSHVAKPFDIAHLINTVNDHIAASKQK